nr:zinc finger BED domain-containing protein RICESLEEPER 2-like [Tanacetum cinerariifolium]
WERTLRDSIKNDCVKVYEIEKKKLKNYLKGINRINVTTDMWKSTNQKIEYMVLTGYFVDSNWRLQKRVLSFIHLPPPRRGTDIVDNLYKCFKYSSIENKVFTISVDNASNNDKAIKNLRETFSRIKKLPCGVHRIKVLLDKLFFDPSQDKFIHDMVKFMKENFDKYWKECNLLMMSVVAVLDLRCKMTVAKFIFPRMYSGDEPKVNIKIVVDALSELYKEYVSEYYSSGSRVIDTYRASLALETVEVLLCGGDWCRSLHGLKRKNKKEKIPIEVILPITGTRNFSPEARAHNHFVSLNAG